MKTENNAFAALDSTNIVPLTTTEKSYSKCGKNLYRMTTHCLQQSNNLIRGAIKDISIQTMISFSVPSMSLLERSKLTKELHSILAESAKQSFMKLSQVI